jgi:uncharacterized protein (TIRG00374 family)
VSLLLTAKKNILMRSGILFLLFGLTIFVIYLYFFVGMAELVAAVGEMDPVYYSLAVLALLLGTAFYSLAWQHILGLLQIKSAFRKTFFFIWVGSFVDLVIPAESFSGELSKIYLMSKNSGEDMGKVAASVVSHRILTMATMLFGIIVGSTFLFFGYETSQLVVNMMLFVAASTFVVLFLMCYLSLKPQVTMKIAALIVRFLSFVSRGRWELTRFKLELEEALTAFHQGMRILTERPKNLLAPLLFSAVAFLLDLSIAFFVLFSLDFPVSLNVVLIVYTIVNAIQAIPLGIPGEVGITDVAMVSLYSLLGIPPGVSGAATVLTRVLTVWLKIFVGYAVVQWMGITILHGHDARAKTN